MHFGCCCLYLKFKHAVLGTHFSYLGCLSRTTIQYFLLDVSESEEGVVALNIPIGRLKTRFGLEPVRRCEPSTYQGINRWLSHCAIKAGTCSLVLDTAEGE